MNRPGKIDIQGANENVVLALLQDGAPVGGRWLDAQAEEAERRLDLQGQGKQDHVLQQHQGQHVRRTCRSTIADSGTPMDRAAST